MRIPSIGVALLLLGPLSAAQVHMKDGRMLEGDILDGPREQVDLQVRSGSITAVLHLPRADVVRIIDAPSEHLRQLRLIEERYRSAAGEKDLATIWQLAKDLQERHETLAWRQMLRRILELEADHALARSALGYEQVDGVWLQGAELMRAKGLVFHANRWVTPEERDRHVAEEQARQDRLTEMAQVRWQRAADRSSGPTTGIGQFGFSTGYFTSTSIGGYGYPYAGGYGNPYAYGYYDRYRCDDGPSVLITQPGFNGSDSVQIHHLRPPRRAPVILTVE